MRVCRRRSVPLDTGIGNRIANSGITAARIRQFLDIGTGLPTVDNTHEVAQRLAAECRIVYVDNDPLVLVHARALLTSTPEGACAYIDADVRDPDAILAEAAKRSTLMMLGIMGADPGHRGPGGNRPPSAGRPTGG